MRHKCVDVTREAELVQVVLVIYLGGGCETLHAEGLGHCFCADSGITE